MENSMKNNLKNILHEIQKIAGAPAGASFPGGRPAGGASAGGASAGGSSGDSSATPAAAANAVKSMQEAIQKFADAVTAYNLETVPVPGVKNKFVRQVKKDDTRKDFNDFIAERGSSIKTEEWDPDPKATSIPSKRPTDRIQLDVVIDLLKRTGSSFSEKKPDGIWDQRTQNAIKTVWALTDSFIRIADDYGLSTQIRETFSPEDFRALVSAIPKGDLSEISKMPPAEKEKKAKILTPLVRKATNLYNSFQKIILNNPIYRNYIEGAYDLMTAEPGKPDPGQIPDNLKDKNLNEEYISNFYVTSGDGSRKWVNNKVPLAAFKDVPGYLKFLRWIGYNESNGIDNLTIQSKVLKEIMDQVF
jgi:hypothetical protein